MVVGVGVGGGIDDYGGANGIAEKVVDLVLGQVGDVAHVETPGVAGLLRLEHPRSGGGGGHNTGQDSAVDGPGAEEVIPLEGRAGFVHGGLFGGGLHVEEGFAGAAFAAAFFEPGAFFFVRVEVDATSVASTAAVAAATAVVASASSSSAPVVATTSSSPSAARTIVEVVPSSVALVSVSAVSALVSPVSSSTATVVAAAADIAHASELISFRRRSSGPSPASSSVGIAVVATATSSIAAAIGKTILSGNASGSSPTLAFLCHHPGGFIDSGAPAEASRGLSVIHFLKKRA
mmetsp:Transcript_12332/g.24193  ORF Transcript_12332/g.24193 Transcript_12332/m.24193 type:complete len:291 (-) Transcript_12332:3-875(-)